MPATLTFAPIQGATEDEQQCYEALEFQPTCPVRGTTPAFLLRCVPAPYFNPRAPYGARRNNSGADLLCYLFQSSCPLRGATRPCTDRRPCPMDFNPRAPYGSRRYLRTYAKVEKLWGFQSTCPVRGTTAICFLRRSERKHFNPRAPYGARLRRAEMHRASQPISIHVPRTGHDRGHIACGCGR